MLDQLAASSPFSQLSQPLEEIPNPSDVLTRLFRQSNLSPYAASVLTQIILRDLRPLLSPLPRLPIRNPTAMLRLKSNAGPAQLELRAALQVWDRQMAGLYYGGVGDLDRCAEMVDVLGGGPGRADEGSTSGTGATSAGLDFGPVMGVNIPVRSDPPFCNPLFCTIRVTV